MLSTQLKSGGGLQAKTVWVTGGAGYLGSAITTALDESAGRILCIDLGDRAKRLVDQAGLRRTIPVSMDLADLEALPRWLSEMTDTHGVPEGLVYLAFASSAGTRLEDLSPDIFSRTLVNALTPAFTLCRGLAERMKQSPAGGSIVLFSSMYGRVAPDPGQYPPPLTPNPIDYGASKAGLLQMMRYLAAHYGPHQIRFNCITPGPFPNPGVQEKSPEFVSGLGRKTMLRRVGRRDEVVGPTLFLLGDGASFVTGHSLVVDGGWTAW